MADPLDILNADRQAALSYAQKANKTRLRKLLTAAQADLNKRIDQAVGKGLTEDSFTVAQARATLAQIKAVTDQVKKGILSTTIEAGKQSASKGIQSSIAFLQESEQKFKGAARPTIGLNTARVFDRAYSKTESSVLHRLVADPQAPQRPGILDRYGEEVIQQFEERLQLATVTGKSWGDVRRELIQDSPFLKAAPAHWAERIVRTETMHANNRAGFEAMNEINEVTDGGMIRILSATIDDRTGADSLAVHGQIRRMNEAFDHWRGSFMYPPNRPNDREIVVPHHMDWPIPPELKPRSDAEIAARWQAEGRRGAPPPRPPISTVPIEEIGKQKVEPTLFPEPPDREQTIPGPERRPESMPGSKLADEKIAKAKAEAEAAIVALPAGKKEALELVQASTMTGPMGTLHTLKASTGLKTFDEDWWDEIMDAAVEVEGTGKKGKAKPTSAAPKSTKFFAPSKLQKADVQTMIGSIDAKQVEAEIKAPTKQPIVAVQKNGKLVVVSGFDKLAAKLAQKKGVTLTIYDYDKLKKDQTARVDTKRKAVIDAINKANELINNIGVAANPTAAFEQAKTAIRAAKKLAGAFVAWTEKSKAGQAWIATAKALEQETAKMLETAAKATKSKIADVLDFMIQVTEDTIAAAQDAAKQILSTPDEFTYQQAIDQAKLAIKTADSYTKKTQEWKAAGGWKAKAADLTSRAKATLELAEANKAKAKSLAAATPATTAKPATDQDVDLFAILDQSTEDAVKQKQIDSVKQAGAKKEAEKQAQAKKEAEAKKPQEDKEAAAAAKAAAEKPAAPILEEDQVLGKKLAGPGGSNEGGIYEGTDGVKRYVKLYQDKSQASGEHLANQIYADLGVGALDSAVVRLKDGRLAYSSRLIDGAEQVGSKLDADVARQVMKGFAADVLTGNWDAVGMSIDNIVKLPDGKVIRIDNGGTFLMRAKAGRKPKGVLGEISEIDKFFDSGINPHYSKVMAAGGYSSPLSFLDDFEDQFKRLQKIATASGGWGAYVDRHAPLLEPADRKQIVDMLEKRSDLLTKKIAELRVTQAKIEARRRSGFIAAEDLDSLPTTRLDSIRERGSSPHGFSDDYSQGSKEVRELEETARKKVGAMPPKWRSAMKAFTGSAYGAMRAAAECETFEQWQNHWWVIKERLTNDRSQYNQSRALAEDMDAGFRAQRRATSGNQTLTPEERMTRLFRGMYSIPKDVFETLINAKEHIFEGPTSTSWKLEVSERFYREGSDTHGIMFVINTKDGGPSGIYVGQQSTVSTEREVLFPRGARFRVDRVEKDAGKNRSAVIYMTELGVEGDDPPSPPKPKRTRKPRAKKATQ